MNDKKTEEAKAHFLEFLSHMEKDEFDKAEEQILAAYEILPERPSIVTNLLAISVQNENYEFAADVFERFNENNDTDEFSDYYYAISLSHTNRFAQSQKFIQENMAEITNSPSLYKLIGDNYFYMGDFENSLQHFQTAKNLLNGSKDDPLNDKIASLEHWEGILDFRIVRSLERLGRHEECWELCAELNRPAADATVEDYKIDADARWNMLSALSEFPPAETSADESTIDIPYTIFIWGPSRSGKTSLEKFFDVFPGIAKLGETRIIRDIVDETGAAINDQSLSPELLKEKRIEYFYNRYVEYLRKNHKGEKAVIFTAPGDLQYMNVVMGIPKSRFIFVERDLYDLIFRIFSSYYIVKPIITSDIQRIHDHVKWYRQLSGFLYENYKDKSIAISYDELVEDPRAIVGRLCEFLDFTPAEMKLREPYDDRGCGQPYISYMRELGVAEH